jgi:voltage-gated potassium channel
MTVLRPPISAPRWQRVMYEIIFESDTFAGKAFDVALLINISVSVLVVILESIPNMQVRYGALLTGIEWYFTIIFTVEYLLRLYSVRKAMRYAFSFYGVVDLLAILPTYLSLLVPGAQYFLVIRILRLLRVFRILKMATYTDEAEILGRALWASRRKIGIFLFTVLTLTFILGSAIYVVEGEEGGFSSIPTGIYWTIVTLTTVGYGDFVPSTAMGKFLASIVMLLGYSIIAVPTGIVSVEMAHTARFSRDIRACTCCGYHGHEEDAAYCKYCGEALERVEDRD